jgi:hypothetical protein
MKVRLLDNHAMTGHCQTSNPMGIGEVLVSFEDGDASSEMIGDLEVLLERVPGKDPFWYPMRLAFREKHLIEDNYARSFREPRNEEERTRGWYDY